MCTVIFTEVAKIESVHKSYVHIGLSLSLPQRPDKVVFANVLVSFIGCIFIVLYRVRYKAWMQPSVQSWLCLGPHIQILYYFRFTCHSLSFGILLKSMNVGQDVTTFTDVIVNDLYKMYTKMTVKCFKGPYF